VCYLSAEEAIWLRCFPQNLNLTPRVDDPIKMMCDNTTAIEFAKDPKFHMRTKHIKRHYHLVRDAIKRIEVAIKYISTSKMIADPLTEPIPRDDFKAHVISLGLRRT